MAADLTAIIKHEKAVMSTQSGLNWWKTESNRLTGEVFFNFAATQYQTFLRLLTFSLISLPPEATYR